MERTRALCDALHAFVSASTDSARLLETIADRTMHVVADGCAVCLLAEDSLTMKVTAARHRDAKAERFLHEYLGRTLTLDSKHVTARVARTGEAFVLAHADPPGLARAFKPEIAALLTSTDTRGVVVVPLQVEGRTVGVIVATRNGADAAPFDEESLAVVRMLADGAALAIHNARLLDSYRREIEERRRAEEQAKHFVALVEHSSDFIAMATLEGEILFVNQAGKALLGVEPSDALRLEDYHTAEGMNRAAIIRTKGRWEGEGVLRHSKTGELIPTQVSSFLVRDGDHEPIAFATVQRDLRQVRRLEHHMRHMQKMDAIGRLAAGVAHDFNNMLSIILSYGSLVLDELPEGAHVRPEVEEMIAAGRRAGQLTHQLLAFSRQQVLEPRVVGLNEVVSGIERMARKLLREDIHLTTALGPDLEPVRVDVGQIEQVILNLAANARDAMPDGGSLTITTDGHVVEAGGESDALLSPGRYVTLRITDTGVGMDEATLSRVFEPFFTTKAPGAGTGLGLATVFGVVKQSGGHVAVTSRAGRGTTFTLYLPAYQGVDEGEAAARTTGRAAPRAGGTETVLLVEDEARVRKLVEGILRRAGYRVIEASSASAALEACSRADESIDLLLTDVVMPRVSGPQLAARFMAARPAGKVLYMSGYMDVQTIDMGLEFLRKPFTPEALLGRVRDVLDGKAATTSSPRPARSSHSAAAARPIVPPSSS